MSVKKFLKAAKKIQEERHHRPAEDHVEAAVEEEGGWLVSYADMMTLLCGFFILLFSMSKIDEPQYEKVRESVSKQFGGDFKSPTQDLAKFVTQILQEGGLERETSIKVDGAGVAITFQSTAFFDTLSAEIRPEGLSLLNRLTEALAARQVQELKTYNVVVEGHTDSRPVTAGPYPSNWELSAARASRVVRLFLAQGFDKGHLTAIAYGDTRPAVVSRSPANWPEGGWDEAALAKNRRVVIRVLDPKVEAIPMAEAPVDPEKQYGPAN